MAPTFSRFINCAAFTTVSFGRQQTVFVVITFLHFLMEQFSSHGRNQILSGYRVPAFHCSAGFVRKRYLATMLATRLKDRVAGRHVI
jgi:hypothetical protein